MGSWYQIDVWLAGVAESNTVHDDMSVPRPVVARCDGRHVSAVIELGFVNGTGTVT